MPKTRSVSRYERANAKAKRRTTGSGGIWVLQHERDSLARADADAEHAIALLAQAQLRGQREHVAGAGRAERVADRDRAPVGIEALVRHLEAVELARQLAQDPERLGGVRL